MKRKILVVLPMIALFFLVAPKSAFALDAVNISALQQQVQILIQEIGNMKSLIANSRSLAPISSTSYIAVDLNSGRVLLKNNETAQYPIASVTKLMTAVVARQKIDDSDQITLTGAMLTPYGNSPAVYSGLKINSNDLLYASLTQSVNDAAESLSYFLGKEEFLGAMNKKAKKLGMKSTVYADVMGLDAKSKSTAADLEKLLAYIYEKDPKILEITKNNDFWLPDATGRMLKFQNLNGFYYHPEFFGGKTGYLPEARQTFAAVFNINKKPVAIVVLNSRNYQADTFKIINQIKNNDKK